MKWGIILLIILGVVLVGLIVLSLIGRKLQKKSDAAQENIMAGAQYYSIMVIDKKRMKLSQAGFPQIIIDQTPKWLRGRKIPVVKAKIGPKIASLMCDDKVFDKVPVKKEVKALMNGIYIIDVKGLRSGLDTAPVKKGFFSKLRTKAQNVLDEEKKQKKAKETAETKKGKKK
ncbi:MAG: hypothetical protein J1E35_08705 [Lachnospiraceae bacterium]|nr:hypothetical protein [Lachnospiraceae bacterium]